MQPQSIYKICPQCRQMILDSLKFCPECGESQADPKDQPPTRLEVLAYVGVGAALVGAALGFLSGGVLGLVGAKGWGDLIGLVLGQDDLGNRWVKALGWYPAYLGSLLCAGLWAWMQIDRVRMYLDQNQKAKTPGANDDPKDRP